jgi:hypothetical protein
VCTICFNPRPPLLRIKPLPSHQELHPLPDVAGEGHARLAGVEGREVDLQEEGIVSHLVCSKGVCAWVSRLFAGDALLELSNWCSLTCTTKSRALACMGGKRAFQAHIGHQSLLEGQIVSWGEFVHAHVLNVHSATVYTHKHTHQG